MFTKLTICGTSTRTTPRVRPARSFAPMVVVGVVWAVIAAGATYALVRHDGGRSANADAPVVLTGVLRDTSGRPVADAKVQMMASDDANAKVGQTIPVVGLASAQTNAAGRFTIRQSQSAPIIRKLAGENGGWVNFDVYITAHAHFMPWAVTRKIGLNGWIADENVPAHLKQERITFRAL